MQKKNDGETIVKGISGCNSGDRQRMEECPCTCHIFPKELIDALFTMEKLSVFVLEIRAHGFGSVDMVETCRAYVAHLHVEYLYNCCHGVFVHHYATSNKAVLSQVHMVCIKPGHACNHHEKHYEKSVLAESWDLCLFMANMLLCSVVIFDLPLGSVIGSHFKSHHIDLWLLTWPCLHGHLMSLADVGKELKHVSTFLRKKSRRPASSVTAMEDNLQRSRPRRVSVPQPKNFIEHALMYTRIGVCILETAWKKKQTIAQLFWTRRDQGVKSLLVTTNSTDGM